MYIQRALEKQLHKYLTGFPVVCVTGPRQSGKSTMLKNVLADFEYVTFDDARMRALFEDDPVRFFSDFNRQVIFDEVQKVPTIFEHLKQAVDSDRAVYGRFVLTGSSQFALLKESSDSMAGRIGLLSLLPFELGEVPAHLHDDSLFKGAYPELVTRDYRLWEEWYGAYVETYLQKDVRLMANIGDMRDFRRLLQLLAARVSQVLNMSTLANEIGVSVPSIKRWLSVLEASYVVFLLPAFSNNLGKRIVKSPKVYFYDCGLVSFLTRIQTRAMYENGALAGAMFENYVVSETVKKILHQKSRANCTFFRTNHGDEIDLIVDSGTQVSCIEIKSSMTYRPPMVKTLKKIKVPNATPYLVYRGETLKGSDIAIWNYKEWLRDCV